MADKPVVVWLTDEARVGQAGNNQHANKTRLTPACRARTI
jgi:hypothetical protein